MPLCSLLSCSMELPFTDSSKLEILESTMSTPWFLPLTSNCATRPTSFYPVVSFVFDPYSTILLTSLVAQTVKHLPTMEETQVWSLGGEDPLEKEMATHSSTLAWKIPRREEHGRLQSMGPQRVGHNWATSLSFFLQSFSLTTSDLFPRLLQ